MKSFWKLLALGTAFGFAATANAAYYQGVVTSVQANGGKVLVVVSNGSGSGLCGSTAVFYLDPTVEYEKVMLSIAMSARVTGLLVWVGADDTCQTAWPITNTQHMVAIDLKG